MVFPKQIWQWKVDLVYNSPSKKKVENLLQTHQQTYPFNLNIYNIKGF